MNDTPKLGIRVDGSVTPQECVEMAVAADRAGLAGVWFAENAFARGIWPAAAACAAATKRIHIHAGVFNPFTRHPAMMAMEMAALSDLAGDRASISIGAGIMSATAKLEIDAQRPVPALRDAIAILRGLLRGEEVDYTGPRFSAKKVKLEQPPKHDIPIFLAGRGNLTVKLAGEGADGLLVSNMCSAGYAGHSAELMRDARPSKAGGAVVQYMPCVVNQSSKAALEEATRIVGEMVPRFWALSQKVPSAKEALLLDTAIAEHEFIEVSLRLANGEDPVSVLDERYALAFSLFGTPDECLALATKYKKQGVDELGLTFAGDHAVESIAALGQRMSALQ
ncbi:LLM class flavin-dependent oxidoreductase [Tardiphaga sp.]|jgi:5,10-methylenetetrahydromethanopterin reductase|uniref:LLM class flavin-dependent oxidoreductase n=1 Tax=Tardiphaga sp. TaxID=1926292 RepID=UPI0037DA6506